MFGKRKKENHFISRITDYMNRTNYHVSCAKQTEPMFNAFFKKTMSAKTNWKDRNGRSWDGTIETAVRYLAMNTRNYERMSEEEVKVFQKIFEEFDLLHAEALKLNSQSQNKGYLMNKLICISEIIRINRIGMHDLDEQHEHWRDGMIFQNYENLWKVIHRVNTEWDELCSRGFPLKICQYFYDVCEYAKSCGEEMQEEDKIKTFMALLDGKMKIIPVYRHEYSPLGFKVVDNDFDDEIIYTFDVKNNKSYRMRQVGEEVDSCQ